ncbi:cation-transporting P-type ATPase [Afifella marina]|uniref:Potassium and/or sodium efflux P-type ATPase n=1 Tax=Afifella marina DSM 2698 TaxID=1120955 RepID=A0A1G5M656_AFIMA|nr:cation-transporting P-type ATPase [Afifella marina]MBK1622964.1 carbonate dehydratase [Afifella marina DSM 2698]MBK1625958.1 carbonate dehydratase [Afifella marina]MBK5917782.1 carbonate dehydratase [Afifella marina]RAI23690.1 carbonate dehydratase [Afifella marina DSM 2698]SCZ20241.1 potassium and/or sodium efflux P-type ATPase [Afifella marina DSM 2698]
MVRDIRGEGRDETALSRGRAAEARADVAVHAAPLETVFDTFGASRDGLSTAEADDRLARFGENRLPVAKPRGPLLRFLAQFNNLLIFVLLAAAVVTACLAEWIDMSLILAVVVINAVVGFIQEGRAEKALEAIRGMVSPHASVLRDGRRLTVPVEELVPGDVVLLEAGDRVPADLRLFRARGLRIEEAAFTGESVPADKALGEVAADAPIGDRISMAFFGTLVVNGQGAGVVVATGEATELGHITRLLSSVEQLTTPLLRQMDVFARQLTFVILGAAALVFLWGVFLTGYPWEEAFMAVIGLAVAAIPEGLPAVMTITLAIGVERMARRNAIIRRLPAIETLGSVSVICSDKTGTLTRNEMIVSSAILADGEIEIVGSGYAPEGEPIRNGEPVDKEAHFALGLLARAALLCNDASLRQTEDGWVVEGDPMEGALVTFAARAGWHWETTRGAFERRDELPFDSTTQFMATLHQEDDARIVYVKGAPECVLRMCDRQVDADGEVPLDRAKWQSHVEMLAADGRRVLAFAAKVVGESVEALSPADVEEGLSLIGLVGLIDPPREEARDAVADCKRAGIAVKMITGDHAATAGAIGRRLGLSGDVAVLTGPELDKIGEADFPARVAATDVFARASPAHKLRIVEALQAQGAVVAMTGDGVNDAPALKRADVGVAMGKKGTEAAKEAADMVLADDNFVSIVAAVREGRTVYDNLKKVVAWTLPTNGGEAAAIMGAMLFGLTLPVTPAQIIWINMVTAVTLGLTLAFEPTEPGTMGRPPRRPDEPLVSPFLLWRIVFVSGLFVIGLFGMFNWALWRGESVETARTIVVNTMVVMEIAYLFSIRYIGGPSLTWRGLMGTRAVLIGVAIQVVAQLLFTYAPPAQFIFASRALSVGEGAMILGVGVVLFAVLEVEKGVMRRWRG